MKKLKGLSVAVLGLGLLSQSVSADLFGALNKAAETVNSANTAVNNTAANVQAAQASVNSLKTVAAKEVLMNALSSQLTTGSTTQADLVSLLGEPVKSKTKNKTQTLTYKVDAIAEQLETAELIANAVGIQTPDISGTLNVVLQNDVLKSYSVDNFLVQ
jgi:hypothetical protein